MKKTEDKRIFPKKRLILLLVFVLLFTIKGYTQKEVDSEIETWKKELFLSIEKEVKSHFSRKCKEEHYHSSVDFFANELQYFPISKSFEKLEDIIENTDLNSNSYIFFWLYYPFVGFDPETGYDTSIVVKESKRSFIFYEYNSEQEKFILGKGNRKYLKKAMKSKSDCYGAGYYFITVFNKDLKIEKMKIVLAIEI